MANFTANYGLHQWEPTDPFLREDFNRDFSTIDAALGRAERSAEANAYNVYNLMLQNDYEGKYTGYKKALLFDGFLDESGIAEKSNSLLIGNQAVCLYRIGQQPVEWLYSSNVNGYTYPLSTNTGTATSVGILTGVTLFPTSGDESDEQTIECWINGQLYESGKVRYADRVGTKLTWLLENPPQVVPGDTFYFKIHDHEGGIYYSGEGLYTLSARVEFEAIQGESGWLKVQATPGEDWSSLHLWLRRQGGGVTPTINDLPMALADSRETCTLDGEPCMEEHWTGPAGGGELTLMLTLALESEDEHMALFDYGLALL